MKRLKSRRGVRVYRSEDSLRVDMGWSCLSRIIGAVLLIAAVSLPLLGKWGYGQEYLVACQRLTGWHVLGIVVGGTVLMVALWTHVNVLIIGPEETTHIRRLFGISRRFKTPTRSIARTEVETRKVGTRQTGYHDEYWSYLVLLQSPGSHRLAKNLSPARARFICSEISDFLKQTRLGSATWLDGVPTEAC